MKNKTFDFRAGELLLVDKPLEWTSFDVVNKIKYALNHGLAKGERIKVGHAGTLDPLATGLLIVATGKSTKKLGELQGLNKCYEGTIRLGGTTPSYDLETEVDEEFDIEHITAEDLEKAKASLTGSITQIPPIFSAVRIDGERAYKKARRNDIKKLPDARNITIKSFEFLKTNLPDVDFRVECSKGTYIRSLAFDFGRALNNGAYLTRLVRTSVEEFELKDAYSLEEIVGIIQKAKDEDPFLPRKDQ